MVFLRKFEEPVVPYTGARTIDALGDWLKPLMVEPVFEFTEEAIDSVMDNKSPTLILFSDSTTDKDAAFINVFTEAAIANKGKILFTYADVSGDIQMKLAEFLGVTKEQMPTLRALLPDGMMKYKCDT